MTKFNQRMLGLAVSALGLLSTGFAAAQDAAEGADAPPAEPVTLDSIWATVVEEGPKFGLKLLGGIALWIVGRFLISRAEGLFNRVMKKTLPDDTLRRYLGSTLGVILRVVLIVAILGFFGIETTTFAALLAGAGLAIGTAWGGLLTNFAAGVFLVILKPFGKGDFINAGGVIGTVEDIGLFVTTIDTMDNVRTVVGNNKIFSDNIQNFTANPFRRVDLVAQLEHGADHAKAIDLLKEALRKIPNVHDTDPTVEILEFNLAGPVLCVRPYVHNDHYWQVYFDTNRTIRETLGGAGFQVPWQEYQIRQKSA